jgi:hypothetical protein
MADGTADGPASGVVQVQLLLLRVAELSAGKPYRNTLTRSPEVWKKSQTCNKAIISLTAVEILSNMILLKEDLQTYIREAGFKKNTFANEFEEKTC